MHARIIPHKKIPIYSHAKYLYMDILHVHIYTYIYIHITHISLWNTCFHISLWEMRARAQWLSEFSSSFYRFARQYPRYERAQCLLFIVPPKQRGVESPPGVEIESI